jgi:NAD(P)-dependent dehydrogenase (short-subunit alcohol dehydrogenase family)
MSGIIITEGTRALGARVAFRLVRAGRPVAVTYRGNQADARALLAQLEPAGVPVIMIRADAADGREMEEAALLAREAIGEIGGIVVCATGLKGDPRGGLLARPPSLIEDVMARRLRTVLVPVRAAAPLLVDAGGGTVVFVGIEAAPGAPGRLNGIATADVVAESAMHCLGAELRRFGIRTHLIRAPGPSVAESWQRAPRAPIGGPEPGPLAKRVCSRDVANEIVALFDARFAVEAVVAGG